MTQDEFFKHIEQSYKDGISLIKIKNADYANSTNPFKNFESAYVVGIDVGQAILVRILDKLSRVGNLLKTEASVKEESVEDTLLDLINYTAILKAYLYDCKRKRNNQGDLPRHCHCHKKD